MNTNEQFHEVNIVRTNKTQLQRARFAAIVLAMSTIISLVFLVFAFVQKHKVSRLETELSAARQALESCQQGK